MVFFFVCAWEYMVGLGNGQTEKASCLLDWPKYCHSLCNLEPCHGSTLTEAEFVVGCSGQRHCTQCLGAPLGRTKIRKKRCGIVHLLLGTIKREGSTHVGCMKVTLKVNIAWWYVENNQRRKEKKTKDEDRIFVIDWKRLNVEMSYMLD